MAPTRARGGNGPRRILATVEAETHSGLTQEDEIKNWNRRVSVPEASVTVSATGVSPKENKEGKIQDWLSEQDPNLASIQKESVAALELEEWTVNTLNLSVCELKMGSKGSIYFNLNQLRVVKVAADAHSSVVLQAKKEIERLTAEVYETPPSEDHPTGTKWKDVAEWNGYACVENQKLLATAEAALEQIAAGNKVYDSAKAPEKIAGKALASLEIKEASKTGDAP